MPPRGRRIDTGSGKRPVSIAVNAARAAAAAQAPVVQPRRSAVVASRAIKPILAKAAGMTTFWPFGTWLVAWQVAFDR